MENQDLKEDLLHRLNKEAEKKKNNRLNFNNSQDKCLDNLNFKDSLLREEGILL